ncbi:MAG: hypothetical protein S4CHLAM6_02500 [Chlamydiae bacterium]|nr:hypothetical protein [Chlamydiota bacterium]
MNVSGFLRGADQLARYVAGMATASVMGSAGGLLQAQQRLQELVPEGANLGRLRGLGTAEAINRCGPTVMPIVTLALGCSIMSPSSDDDVVNSLLTILTVHLANKTINYPKYSVHLEEVGRLVGGSSAAVYAVVKGFFEGARTSAPKGFSLGRLFYDITALPGGVIGGIIDRIVDRGKGYLESHNADIKSTAFKSLGKVASFVTAMGYFYTKAEPLIVQLSTLVEE